MMPFEPFIFHIMNPSAFLTLWLLTVASLFIFYLHLATPQAFAAATPELKKSNIIKEGFADLPLCKTFYILHQHDASKPLVVFLHGFTASTQSYKPIMQRLGGSEINYLSFDFVSHGKSDMIPSHLDMSNELLETQVCQLLDHLFEENIPDLIIVGHSQAGAFAPRYALKYSSRVKSVILITPGGIDFQWKDYIDNPLYFPVRNLYLLGCNKYTQSIAVRTAAFFVSHYHSFFWKPFSKPIFYHWVPSFLNLSNPSTQLCQEYWNLLDDWLTNFERFTNTPEKREGHLRMVRTMLDNLDLLRDNTAMFESLAKTGINVELVLARYDPVVTMQAGNRLFHKMQPSAESKRLKSFMYASSEHLMPSLLPSEYSEKSDDYSVGDDDVLSDDSSLFSRSPNVNVHILKATHLVPIETPGKLCQIIWDSYSNAIDLRTLS